MKTRRLQFLGPFVIVVLLLTRPVEAQLDWSTFLGGTDDDRTYSVARDPSGFVYVAGHTVSATFPAATPTVSTHIPPTPQGGWNVFVCKLDPTQTLVSQLIWCTIIGGSGDDQAFGIAIDPSGNVVVTGSTTSGNFPTTPNCYDPSPNGGIDAFVLELSASGSTLLYSTYVGGSGNDHAQEVDASNGLLTLAGYTNSANFPTQNPYRANLAGPSDVFVATIDANLGSTGLIYGTYLGGSGWDGDGAGLPGPFQGGPKYMGLHVDSQGVITVAGSTSSVDFPSSPGAYQVGSAGLIDGFVAMLDPVLQPAAAQLIYATCLGGSEDDSALTMDRVGPNRIVLGGHTYSGNFPFTAGAYDTTFGGTSGVDEEAFLAVFDRSVTGSWQLVYSTFVGGLGDDSINTLATDASGAIVFGGYTTSPDFLTTAGALAPIALPSTGVFIGMVGRLIPALTGSCDLEYATFLGGSTAQQVTDIDFDPSLGVYLAGMTASRNFPTTLTAYQTSHGGGRDAWTAHLGLLPSGTLPGGASFGASRYGWGTPAAASGGPVMSTGDGPVPGSGCFSLVCRRAPANASGFLGLTYDVASVSTALPCPFFVGGAAVWLNPAHPTFTLLTVGPSDALGGCVVPFPLTGMPASLGLQVITQFGWVDPVNGAIHTSDVLRVSI